MRNQAIKILSLTCCIAFSMLTASFSNAATTERVSIDSNGKEGFSDSMYPSISSDGRYVAFESGASNLVSGDSNNAWDIFVMTG